MPSAARGGESGSDAGDPGTPLAFADVPLAAFAGLMRDYGLLCESYFEAVRSAGSQRIEAVDMARRSLHDEGAARLEEALAPALATDRETSRRLFSLLYALRSPAPGPAGAGAGVRPAGEEGSGGTAGEGAGAQAGLPVRLRAVLFVCNQNAIRSPMAADLARTALGPSVAVLSAAAGTAREEVDGFVVAVMAEEGRTLAHWRPPRARRGGAAAARPRGGAGGRRPLGPR